MKILQIAPSKGDVLVLVQHDDGRKRTWKVLQEGWMEGPNILQNVPPSTSPTVYAPQFKSTDWIAYSPRPPFHTEEIKTQLDSEWATILTEIFNAGWQKLVNR